MRNYNIDAYRTFRNLIASLSTSCNHSELVIGCYETCINLLSDVYYNHGCSYPEIKETDLKSLIEALATRKFNLSNTFTDWKRLYHVYNLVYDGYINAKSEDTIASLVTLRAIMSWYVEEVPMNNLIKTHDFAISNMPLKDEHKRDEKANRLYIADLLGYMKIPDPTF